MPPRPGLPGIPPPRPRAQSHSDATEAERTYGLIQGLAGDVQALGQTVATGFAAQAETNAELKALAEKASAQSVERWTNLAKALVPAVIAIVGGTVGVQRLTAPEPQRATVVSESALSVELDACMTLPESNQRPCMDLAYDRDRFRKVSRQRP